MKEDIHEQIISIVSDEIAVAQRNKSEDVDDFEAYIDLFDAERTERDYDWMSDVYFPEFATRMLTQSAMDANQYFQTKDFVEAYVIENTPTAVAAAKAAQELINKTLNRQDLYHYQKFVRAKLLNTINGNLYLKCWWERKTEEKEVPMMHEGEPMVDDAGEVLTQKVEHVVADQFNYDIVDPRNVFTDSSYCYSLQQKDWVTIRSETTYYKLKQEESQYGYFNLNEVKELSGSPETKTKEETTDRERKKEAFHNTVSNNLDKYERFGKFWMVGDKPGIDEFGEIKSNAKLVETVTTWITDGHTSVLIGFNECPYRDSKGKHYKPIIQGLCYIHPTRDAGVGDGLYCRELEVALNDTMNMSNDRVKLATFPTFKIKKYMSEENTSLYIEPGHPIEVEDPNDLVEMPISDNIAGALNQTGMIKSSMDQATAVFPTTMGNTPQHSSTTATAVAGADQRSDQRANYKALTFENTALNELYWMIMQMTWQYAQPETGFKLMGKKVYGFNPEYDFFFKPISASIETDQTRKAKMNSYDQILQKVVSLQHPSAPKVFNYILSKQLELLGDEAETIKDVLLDESQPMQPAGTGPAGGGEPVSNQNEVPQSEQEMVTREMSSAN